MNPSDARGSIPRHLGIPAALLASWGGLVLLFAAPLALSRPVSWHEAIRFGVSFWSPWLVFLPAVAWLAFRFPIGRGRLLRNAGIHLLGCLLTVGASRAVFRTLPGISPAPQRAGAPRRSAGPARKPLGPPGAFDAFLGLRSALDVLIYGSLVGICAAITGFRTSQERERRAAELEARLADARLQALRMQLNPHFLFNTLNSIATLVRVDPRAAEEMLGNLGELLRRTLDSMGEQEIPLARELEFIAAYLDIEQRRFGDRLRVEQDVPDDLRSALVPALILQPLVENAVRHGIEPCRRPGLISIEARQRDGRLLLVVRDDGRGLPETGPGSAGRRGIGLANTEARLRGLYGRDQHFAFGRAEPRGFRAEVHIPIHREPVRVPGTPDAASA